MQRHVESYECEWKKAIETPEVLKRFRHFVNSDAPDASVVFVAERGQIRPARPRKKHLSRHDVSVCRLPDIVADTGVCALVGGEQVAVFRVGDKVHALGNFDPFSRANVDSSRGDSRADLPYMCTSG